MRHLFGNPRIGWLVCSVHTNVVALARTWQTVRRRVLGIVTVGFAVMGLLVALD